MDTREAPGSSIRFAEENYQKKRESFNFIYKKNNNFATTSNISDNVNNKQLFNVEQMNVCDL
jgi:hypothetical protein